MEVFQKCSIVDVRLGSKYASDYPYIFVVNADCGNHPWPWHDGCSPAFEKMHEIRDLL